MRWKKKNSRNLIETFVTIDISSLTIGKWMLNWQMTVFKRQMPAGKHKMSTANYQMATAKCEMSIAN